MIEDEISRPAALLMIRLIAGILFFSQAYDKIFRLGLTRVAGSVTNLPFRISRGSLYIGIALSSMIELIGGIMLIAGFLVVPAGILLGLNLVAVSIIFSVIRPMWDMQFFFPRLLLLLAILLLPSAWDLWSLDALLFGP